ncbi:Solute carrier family 41 member 1 [Leucoagaricus sp. SymC.cos]|nr:Solute carrier family 41 member 1 [Leucoagaricus sp. SymC.cos]
MPASSPGHNSGHRDTLDDDIEVIAMEDMFDKHNDFPDDSDDDGEDTGEAALLGHRSPRHHFSPQRLWLQTKNIVLESAPTLLLTTISLLFTGKLLDQVSHWRAMKEVDQLIMIIPVVLNLKGNLEMNLSARLGTAANVGDLDEPKQRRAMVIGNLTLLQVQAAVVSFVAAFIAIILGLFVPHEAPSAASTSNSTTSALLARDLWIPYGLVRRKPIPHPHPEAKRNTDLATLLMVASTTMSAACLSGLILGSFMCTLIVLCRKFNRNPDNIAPAIASCLGDLVTLCLIGLVSAILIPFLHTPIPFMVGIIVVVTAVTSLTYTLRNKYVRPLLGVGWTPLFGAMIISSGTGIVLDMFVSKYEGFAILAVVISGLPGAAGSIFVSRLSTALHAAALSKSVTQLSDNQPSPRLVMLTLLFITLPVEIVFLTVLRTDALLPPPFTSVSLSDDTNEEPPTYLTAEFGSIAAQYGGTAMFLSRENQLTDASKLFLTIAYGLASRLPPLAAFVQSAFDANTDLFRNAPHLSMKEQAESLIFKPIQAWVAAEDGDVDVDLLVIIDGLDECDDRKMQTDVVEIVRDVFTKRIEGVRWSWIFSTKTDARFREVFVTGSAAVSPKADEIVISLATEEEMDAFLDCGFAHIRATHPAFPVAIDAGGLTSIPSDHLADEEWPTSQEKAATKWQSAGLYAAGASILAYIANPDDDPRARVHPTNSFIGSQYPSPDHPFSALDKAYRNALSQIPAASVPAAKRILGAISCLQPSSRDQKPPTISQIATLFGVRPDEIQQSLKSLHWAVSVPNKLTSKRNSRMPRLSAGDGELKYHHSTFDHFLRAPSRSLNWALDLEAVHLDLARCCLKNLASGQSSFAIKRWYIDCWRTGEDSEAAMGLLPDLFEFDYSILGDHAIVDRYFVEWLLRLQPTAPSGHTQAPVYGVAEQASMLIADGW